MRLRYHSEHPFRSQGHSNIGCRTYGRRALFALLAGLSLPAWAVESPVIPSTSTVSSASDPLLVGRLPSEHPVQSSTTLPDKPSSALSQLPRTQEKTNATPSSGRLPTLQGHTAPQMVEYKASVVSNTVSLHQNIASVRAPTTAEQLRDFRAELDHLRDVLDALQAREAKLPASALTTPADVVSPETTAPEAVTLPAGTLPSQTVSLAEDVTAKDKEQVKSSAPEQAIATLNSEADKRAYASGVSLAREMTQSLSAQKALGITLNPDLIMAGLKDQFAHSPLRLDEGAIQQTMSGLNAEYIQRADAQRTEQEAAGKKYRLAFRAQKGTFLHDGVWYRVDARGAGQLKPTDLVTVLLTGCLPDGTVFDDSGQEGHAKRVRVDALMPALSQGLQKVGVGGGITVVVPPDKGYGDRGLPPDIPGGATLIFSLTVTGVKDTGVLPAGAQPTRPK